jgi:hypothetical protein
MELAPPTASVRGLGERTLTSGCLPCRSNLTRVAATTFRDSRPQENLQLILGAVEFDPPFPSWPGDSPGHLLPHVVDGVRLTGSL